MPKEQLALEESLVHAVAENGNQTRVLLAGVEEGIHARMDQMDTKLDRLLEHHEKAPPPTREGDLELMARGQ